MSTPTPPTPLILPPSDLSVRAGPIDGEEIWLGTVHWLSRVLVDKMYVEPSVVAQWRSIGPNHVDLEQVRVAGLPMFVDAPQRARVMRRGDNGEVVVGDDRYMSQLEAYHRNSVCSWAVPAKSKQHMPMYLVSDAATEEPYVLAVLMPISTDMSGHKVDVVIR